MPQRLLDYPTYVYSAMSTQVTSTGAPIVTIGDFNQFLIVDRVGINVELVQFAGTATGPWPTRG
jgi:HK97 family phage major capsid protein